MGPSGPKQLSDAQEEHNWFSEGLILRVQQMEGFIAKTVTVKA
jgi:hypothetical protein